MSVVSYEPVNVIRHFHNEVHRLFRDDYFNPGNAGNARNATPATARASGTWAPAVDIKDEGERYVITADVPGVEPKDIEITMEAGVLSIKGARGAQPEQHGAAFSRIERGYGEFERRFNVPEGADADGIAASSAHGVLSISIPKKPAPQPRRIEIQ